jgi:hypothetical protein
VREIPRPERFDLFEALAFVDGFSAIYIAQASVEILDVGVLCNHLALLASKSRIFIYLLLLRDLEACTAARFLQFPSLAEEVASEVFALLHVILQISAFIASIQHARRRLAAVPCFSLFRVHHFPSAYNSTYRIAWYAQNDPTIRFAATAT